MSDLRQTYRDYIVDIGLMQLATVDQETNRPWLCSVWYVMDDEDNVYWCSRKTRRHSQEIGDGGYATCTITKNYNEGLGQKGRALILSGDASLVPQDKIEFVYDLYAQKYNKTESMQSFETFLNGSGVHFFYQITPDQIVWWDELEPGDNPRKIIKG